MLKRVIPLILVLIILAAGLVYLRSTEREQSNNMQELYRQTEPLQREKDALAQEKEALAQRKTELDGSYIIETRDISTAQILFRATSVKLFNQVYPLMRERGIKGVIGVSKSDYPGIAQKDKISLEHYNRLIMDGWGSCVIYDESQALDNYLSSLQRILEKKEIAFPTSIYLPEKKTPYDPSMDEILQKYGINTIIRNAEDGRSETVSEVGEFWRTGAMPWNYTGIDTDLNLLAVTDGGNLTLTATFTDIWDGLLVPTSTVNARNASDQPIQQAFIEFLDMVASVMSKDSYLLGATPTPRPTPTPGPDGEILLELKLHITDFDTAREAHLQAQNSVEAQLAEYHRMQNEIDEQIAAIDERIAELEKRISEIYTAFNIKNYAYGKTTVSGETQ